jgi:hypothetical protein
MESMFKSLNESKMRNDIREEAHAEERHEMLKDCTMNAVFLAAEIMQARMNKEIFESLFSEFYKQCFILNILCEWHNETPEEKEESKKFFKKLFGHGLFSGKTQDRLKESYERIEGEEEDNPNVVRFIEIIQTKPENITAEMKIEAVELFPIAIQDLGVYY